MKGTNVVIDVWGGEEDNVHVARFLRPLSTAMKVVNREIKAGFLVNIAQRDETYGEADDFDRRLLH